MGGGLVVVVWWWCGEWLMRGGRVGGSSGMWVRVDKGVFVAVGCTKVESITSNHKLPLIQ